MKKLKLDLQELKIDSFKTANLKTPVKGKVLGNCTNNDPSCYPPSGQTECSPSCIIPSCDRPCDWTYILPCL